MHTFRQTPTMLLPAILVILAMVVFGSALAEITTSPAALELDVRIETCARIRSGESFAVDVKLSNIGLAPVLVVRHLRDGDASVQVTILDQAGRRIYVSPQVKSKRKLRLDDGRNYIELWTGDFIGRSIQIDGTSGANGNQPFPPGEYRLQANYENADFRGTAEQPAFVGRLQAEAYPFSVLPAVATALEVPLQGSGRCLS